MNITFHCRDPVLKVFQYSFESIIVLDLEGIFICRFWGNGRKFIQLGSSDLKPECCLTLLSTSRSGVRKTNNTVLHNITHIIHNNWNRLKLHKAEFGQILSIGQIRQNNETYHSTAYPNDKANDFFIIISFNNPISVRITGISICDQYQDFGCIRRGACIWLFQNMLPETNVKVTFVMLRINKTPFYHFNQSDCGTGQFLLLIVFLSATVIFKLKTLRTSCVM